MIAMWQYLPQWLRYIKISKHGSLKGSLGGKMQKLALFYGNNGFQQLGVIWAVVWVCSCSEQEMSKNSRTDVVIESESQGNSFPVLSNLALKPHRAESPSATLPWRFQEGFGTGEKMCWPKWNCCNSDLIYSLLFPARLVNNLTSKNFKAEI